MSKKAMRAEARKARTGTFELHTEVWLPVEQVAAIDVLARRLGSSRAAMIRLAVDMLFAIAQGKPVPVTPIIHDLSEIIREYEEELKKRYEAARSNE